MDDCPKTEQSPARSVDSPKQPLAERKPEPFISTARTTGLGFGERTSSFSAGWQPLPSYCDVHRSYPAKVRCTVAATATFLCQDSAQSIPTWSLRDCPHAASACFRERDANCSRNDESPQWKVWIHKFVSPVMSKLPNGASLAFARYFFITAAPSTCRE
jgi:hypothetical protein